MCREQVRLPRDPRGVRLGPRPERVQEAGLLLRLLLLRHCHRRRRRGLLQRVLPRHERSRYWVGLNVRGGGAGGGVARDGRYRRLRRRRSDAVRGLHSLRT